MLHQSTVRRKTSVVGIDNYLWLGGTCSWAFRSACKSLPRTDRVRCSPEPANGPDLSSEASIWCYHQFPQIDDRGYAALLESANGPDLYCEASIGVAWTTNKLNHLRFVAQFYAYVISGNEGLPRCVWPTISAPLTHRRVRN